MCHFFIHIRSYISRLIQKIRGELDFQILGPSSHSKESKNILPDHSSLKQAKLDVQLSFRLYFLAIQLFSDKISLDWKEVYDLVTSVVKADPFPWCWFPWYYGFLMALKHYTVIFPFLSVFNVRCAWTELKQLFALEGDTFLASNHLK